MEGVGLFYSFAGFSPYLPAQKKYAGGKRIVEWGAVHPVYEQELILSGNKGDDSTNGNIGVHDIAKDTIRDMRKDVSSDGRADGYTA